MRVCAWNRQCDCSCDGGSLEGERKRGEAIDRVFTPWPPWRVAPDSFCDGKADFIEGSMLT